LVASDSTPHHLDFKEFARAVTILKPDLVLEPKRRREMLR
jgi:hypothetical protein